MSTQTFDMATVEAIIAKRKSMPGALLPMAVLCCLIVWRHRGNLRDLFAGRERHF